MEVILAKSAGFCFGVRRAVNEVYRCLEEEKDTPIYTFGPIIHNDEVVNDLKNKGVQVVDTLESLAALKSCASRGCRHCRMEHRRRISCKRCGRSTKAGIRP